MSEPARSMLFIGSYPGRNSDHAMHDMLAAAAKTNAPLVGVTSGEIGDRGERGNWIRDVVILLQDHYAFRLAKRGNFTSWEDLPHDEMDQELSTVESVYEWLPYTQDARNARIALNGMQKWEGLAQGVPLQTGLPAPLDFTMSVLGQEGMSHLGFFQKLLKRQVEGIHGIDPSALVQFEMPVSLGLAHGSRFNPKLPSGEIIARSFTDFVAILPEETNIGLHLCVGDLDHIARVDKVDAALVESEVALTGLILNNWPKGRKMPKYVHMPFAAGKNPPLLEQNVYNPLEGLRDVLPADTLLVAGLAHESLGKEDQLRLVPMIEGPLERRVAVATACGLGRMTLDNAHTAMRNMGVAANA